MVTLLIAVAAWLGSLTLFVGLRANASKARLERGDSTRISAHGITAGPSYRRGSVPLGS
jgi:hypothetical protein